MLGGRVAVISRPQKGDYPDMETEEHMGPKSSELKRPGQGIQYRGRGEGTDLNGHHYPGHFSSVEMKLSLIFGAVLLRLPQTFQSLPEIASLSHSPGKRGKAAEAVGGVPTTRAID